ncbi:MAG: hypothetical protein RI897_1813 [Verrucomicrobiota bacterium]
MPVCGGVPKDGNSETPLGSGGRVNGEGDGGIGDGVGIDPEVAGVGVVVPVGVWGEGCGVLGDEGGWGGLLDA